MSATLVGERNCLLSDREFSTTTLGGDELDTVQPDSCRSEASKWDSAINKLLEWRRDAMRDEEFDADPALIDSALDFARGEWEQSSAPGSMAVTPEGGVAFEWRTDGAVLVVEVIEPMIFEVTQFEAGRIIERFQFALPAQGQQEIAVS